MNKNLVLSCILINLLSVSFLQVHGQEMNRRVADGDSVESAALNKTQQFWVRYPVYYNEESEKKYPVVFLIDGDVQLPTLDLVAGNYEGHFLPDMFIIGIDNSENRTRDLTPTKITTRRGFPFQGESGGSESFMDYLEKELIPHIEDNYRVSSFRTLIGHSFGGLFTLEVLLERPELFTYYLAIDPSLGWDNQWLVNQYREDFPEKALKGKSLFITTATASIHMQDQSITMENVTKDTSDYTLFHRSIISMAEFIEKMPEEKIRFSWKDYPNDLHGTIPMPSMRDGLVWMFDWYQLEDFGKFNDFDTPIEELVKLIDYRAKKLETHFGYPVPPLEEELFTMSGFMAQEQEQWEKARAFYEMAIKYYPNSRSAHEALAEFEASQGNNKEAKKPPRER